MKKAKWVASMLVLASLLVLSACSGGSGESGANGSGDTSAGGDGKQGGQDVKVVSVSNDEGSFVEGLDKVSEALKAYGYSLDVNTYADTTAYQSTLRATLSSPDSPGMFKWWSGYRMESLVKENLLADLTEAWETYKEKGVNADLANAFTFDGKVYGLPLAVNYWQVFYNKKVFEANNLQVPTTWDEFLQVAETLKKSGISPIAQTADGRWPGFIWFEELMIKYDPDLYVDLLEGRAKYTDERVVEVMEIWKSLYDKGYFSEPLNWQNTMASEFANGNVGMFVMGDWYNGVLMGQGLKPGEDYGAFILPPIRPEAGNNIIFETGALLISEHSKDRDNAIEASKHLFETDVSGTWTSTIGVAPLVPGVQSDNSVINDIMKEVDEKDYRLLPRYWEGTPTEICEYAVDQFVRFMFNPDEYKNVLETIEAKASSYWSSR
ncbi:ABC transporter substrate-binding protein [Paenibacillus sp. 32O-W]|nr:ABC transporter substrate-binding protein [Paenibacillus sp. 32O-W]